ncbi:MAG: hypothetical protein WBO34_01910 [Gammaproteobacteria bacterium]
MGFSLIRQVRGLLVCLLLLPGATLACDPAQDGCLGCSDMELPICLNAFTNDICNNLGNPSNCDRQRIYDDAERNVMISTGRHMSRILTMSRSARKYQLR